MYSNPRYYKIKGINGDTVTENLEVEINGITSFVPKDLENTDYANIMKLVEEGKLTIAPAE